MSFFNQGSSCRSTDKCLTESQSICEGNAAQCSAPQGLPSPPAQKIGEHIVKSGIDMGPAKGLPANIGISSHIPGFPLPDLNIIFIRK